MKSTYHGSCHCGAVAFEAAIDLERGTFKCNCPICTKTRLWATIVSPDDFRLTRGASELIDYQPYGAHHVFCRTCGVRPFGWGENPQSGERFYAIRIASLDDMDPSDLADARVTYYDGRNENFGSAPAEVRHL